MLCPDVDFETRKHYYETSKASDKPPLFRHPKPGTTVAEAKRIVRNLANKMVNHAISGVVNPDVWEVDPIFAKFADKKLDINESLPSNEISDVEQIISDLLLMRHIVEDNLPFAMLNRPGGKDQTFAQYSKFIRPGVSLPSSTRVSTELLDNYYGIIKDRVKSDIVNQLYEGHATLMFDSSEDVNQEPMTNVLLRITGPSKANVKTYYLTTVFTRTAKSDTEMYKNIVEEVIKDWVGFEKLAGIVTDNTANVKKAREDLMNKYGRLVASQDQAHVADKLMQDFGEISWISDVIKTVSQIAVHYRRFRKVKVRLMEMMKEHNTRLRRGTVVDQDGATQANVDRRESNAGNEQRDRPQDRPSDDFPACATAIPGSDVVEDTGGRATEGPSTSNNLQTVESISDDGSEKHPTEVSLINLASEGYMELYNQVSEADEDEVEEVDSTPDPSTPMIDLVDSDQTLPDSLPESSSSAGMFVPRSSGDAKTIKKMSNVRFASAEKLLAEYISLRKILKKLVLADEFDDLYSFRNDEEKEDRDKTFMHPVLDDGLFKRVIQAQAILSICRTYLRIFDKETALCSEVYEGTRILETMLKTLPRRNFPEPREENFNHLLRVFQNRKEGPLPGMKRVRIKLLSDLHYSAVWYLYP